MNKEQKALIELIRTTLSGQTPPDLNDIDLATLVRTAKFHSVLNTVYPMLIKTRGFEGNLKADADNSYSAFVNQQTLLDYYAETIFAALEDRKLKYMPLKGYYLKKLYPNSLLRSSCDLDVFYDRNDTAAIDEIMSELGFDKIADSENHIHYQLNSFVTVEMHHDLMESTPEYANYYQGIWERLVPETENRRNFTDEDFYIYLLLHMIKHFSHGGFGIRSVADIYVYNHEKPNLNRAYLSEQFNTLGISTFEKKLRQLSEEWFGGAQETPDGKELGDYIMHSGVYGNIINSSVRAVEKAGGNRLKLFFMRAFPPLSIMKKIYPSLNKCPIHLPFLYIHRLIKAIFTKPATIKSTYSGIVRADKSARAAQDALFKKLGL